MTRKLFFIAGHGVIRRAWECGVEHIAAKRAENIRA